MIKQAIILAGGKGERISKIYKNTPKSLVKIAEKAILRHQLEVFERENIKEILIFTHHLSEKIEEFVSKYFSNKLTIKCIKEKTPLGTAGSLLANLDKLDDEFCIVYGDIIFDVDLRKFYQFHISKKSDISLLLHPNDHPKDSDLVEINDDKKIIKFHKYPHQKSTFLPNLVNAAFYIVKKKSLYKHENVSKKLDFGKDIFPKMLKNKKIFGYQSSEYVKDVGTPERIKLTKKHFKSNLIQKRNLRNLRPCIFLDRDGTINKERGYISKHKNFELLPKAAEAIKLINDSNYLAVLITNQPIIARGESSIKNLKLIHNKMEFLISEKKAFLDRLYFCPHHPDKGYKGEKLKYKINCNCRKPKTGLFKLAMKDLNIDMNNSWIIGDSFRDIEAGNKLGINSIYISNKSLEDFDLPIKSSFIEKDLYEAVKKIFSQK
tara:strand:- start:6216 stop:7517 length:1302 start_codon:yes stop_codon:yes gene_type:complete